jgi:tyrosyl-tRNA synthetase
MTTVRTDPELISKFLTRGVENIYPTVDELKKKLMSGERLRVYQGFDPSGPFLHVGHAMGIRALRIMQQLGHEVIFLVGDYTAKVGDPDPSKPGARRMLTDEEISKNMAGWKEQAGQIIDFEGENPVQFRHNFEWLSKLNLAELIKLMSQSTVQQMMERDLFQKRLKENTPIQLQEFIYPLMQGFDSVAMNVDIEIGGNDQTFNMLMGRQLVEKYLGKQKFVRTNQMMDAPDGRTMSKTKGNGLNLADSPENMYGKAMSYPDELIGKGLRLLTDVPLEDILKIENEMQSGANPMQFKKLMAYEIVKEIKSEKAAKLAQEHFEKTVQNKELEDENMKTVKTAGPLTLLEFLRQALDATESVSSVRRTIEQGGVEVNGKKVIEPQLPMNFVEGDVVKFGKRKFFKVGK